MLSGVPHGALIDPLVRRRAFGELRLVPTARNSLRRCGLAKGRAVSGVRFAACAAQRVRLAWCIDGLEILDLAYNVARSERLHPQRRARQTGSPLGSAGVLCLRQTNHAKSCDRSSWAIASKSEHAARLFGRGGADLF